MNPMSEQAQLGEPIAGLDSVGQYRLLESAKTHLEENNVGVSSVEVQIRTSMKHFPELHKRTVTVGATHDELSIHGEPFAMADPYNYIIYVNSRSATEYQTLFHELAHLVIYQENREHNADHPQTSEPYCSIFAMARMPKDLVYRDNIAYLGTPNVPNEEYPAICQRALEYRENNRNYIQKCKEWLDIE